MTRHYGRLAGLLAGLFLATAAQAAPPKAADMGPEAPAAEAANGFVGKLAVTPDHGPIGTTVTVTAEGLPPGQPVDLVWRTVRGRWLTENGEYHGREYAPTGYRIATLPVSATGAISTTFTAPEDFGFAHDVVLQQGGRLLTQTAFSIDMTMSVSPENATLGQPVTIEVKGIGWRDLENSWMLVYDNSFTGWISAVSTAGSAHFTIPATGAEGTHVLRMVHGVFTFPYLNPEQNPYPSRVRPRAEFQLTRGEPVVPPAPERQVQASVRGLQPGGDLSVTPAFGGIDKQLSVEATSLTPGKTYELSWSTVVGNRIAQNGWDTKTSVVATATATSEGKATFQFAAPDDLGGAHDIALQDGDARKSGSYWVTPTALPLDVDHGPAGTDFTIHLKGVGWTETANIFNINYDNAYLGYACGFNSKGDLTVHLTASGAPGWHFIDLYPGIYKGKETRPNDFRIPQLTFANDHPGEDLPAFHFAFKVTERTQAEN